MNRITASCINPSMLNACRFSNSLYSKKAPRCSFATSTSSCQQDSTAINQDTSQDITADPDHVNPNFINRNPRNLEQMALGRKRKGWQFQYPPVQFYHRVKVNFHSNNTSAYVEHCEGDTVVTASTKETCIARQLYSTADVSAAENIGYVLAQRCREAGITSMMFVPPEYADRSDKWARFLAAFQEGGIELNEPHEIQPEYSPGIDYENQDNYQDLLRRRDKVDQKPSLSWGTKKDNYI